MTYTGEDIRSLRQRLGWSAADLSRRLGCSVSRLRELECGTGTIMITEAEQLSRLQMHLNNYNLQLELGPRAEVALRINGFEQINLKDLKT
jgi:transcriptional regulator with XRE-family HTH domain